MLTLVKRYRAQLRTATMTLMQSASPTVCSECLHCKAGLVVQVLSAAQH
jgi:hypothetical protein